LSETERHLLQTLRDLIGTDQSKHLDACRSLATDIVDERAIPDLARILSDATYDAELRGAAEEALLAIFSSHSDPQVQSLMAAGSELMLNSLTLPRALAAFSEALELDAFHAEAYSKRGAVLYLMGDHEASVADCHKATEINPYHFGAVCGLGMCYAAMGERKKALQYWRKALSINPGLDYLKKLSQSVEKSQENE